MESPPTLQRPENVGNIGTNAAGCLFLDSRNESFEDRNVVIYGHNMMDRTMFGSLKDVFQEDFWGRGGPRSDLDSRYGSLFEKI